MEMFLRPGQKSNYFSMIVFERSSKRIFRFEKSAELSWGEREKKVPLNDVLARWIARMACRHEYNTEGIDFRYSYSKIIQARAREEEEEKRANPLKKTKTGQKVLAKNTRSVNSSFLLQEIVF